MKLTEVAVATVLTIASLGATEAVEVKISITNLTQANYFTPRVVVAHTAGADLFEVG